MICVNAGDGSIIGNTKQELTAGTVQEGAYRLIDILVQGRPASFELDVLPLAPPDQGLRLCPIHTVTPTIFMVSLPKISTTFTATL